MKFSLFQGILFGVFGLGALIGVFVFATYTGKNTNTNAVGPVIIWGTLPSEGVEQALVLAGQNDPSFKDISYVEKSAGSLPTELAAAIATGKGPDLVLSSQEQLHAIQKFIAIISPDMLPARSFNTAFIEEGQILMGSTGYYGVPFLVDPLVLFYNRGLLNSSGIAKPPATWESLVGLVSEVASLSSSRQVLRGLIALGTYSNVHNARGILASLFLQQGVPLSMTSANGSLVADLGASSGSGEPPGSSVLSFYTQFADPAKISYTWNASLPDSRQMFLSGDVALYLGYASEARFLTSANPNLNFDVAPVPQPGTARTKAVHGLLYSLMIPRGAANPNGAYHAAVLMSGSLMQVAAAYSTGLAPVSLTILSSPPSADPIAAVAYAEALYAKGWLSPAPLDTDRVFSGMIGDVISGRTSPETALESAEGTLTALLSQ